MARDITFREQPVSIRDWISSEYYLGSEAKALRPYWRDKIIEYFEGDHHEFIFSGSSRAGKTYAVCILILRYIYETYCPVNFPTLFNLSPTTLPKIVFFSFTKEKASSAGIDRLIRMVDSIPWFNHPSRRRRPVTSTLSFSWIEVLSGSNVGHAIGEDAFMGILDEANVRNVNKSQVVGEAQGLLMEINMRSLTTFSYGGKWYGATGIISTAGSTSSFVDSQIIEARTKGTKRFIVEAAVYDVSPANFSSDKFLVFVGDMDVSPFIVDSPRPETVSEIVSASGMSVEAYLAERTSLVLSVPVDLRRFYEDDIETALRNLSGVSRTSQSTLFNKQSLIDGMFDSSLPRYSTSWCPDVGIYDPFDVDDWLDESVLLDNYQGQAVYCHMDISKMNDFTGISCLYYDSDARKIRDLLTCSLFRNINIPDNEIDQTKVLAIISWLHSHGVRFGFVSGDQYASTYVLQQCRLMLGSSFVGQFSVDVDAAAYLAVLNYARKGLYRFPRNPKLARELSALLYDRFLGKVDHPHNTDPAISSKVMRDELGIVPGFHSKDIADCVAGASYHILTRERVSYEDLILQEAVARTPEEEFELFGEDFYSDVLDYKDSKDEELSFMDELESSLY